ncbi:DUF3558 domain-containing protein [Nocardia sp. NBC_00565]|uniref:DUF3558 domain-containing protein n=1 Tax=Nocardia sp. NBC_00565 TaxID=2975993 RepID=UPI002E81BCA4|nr:DUF3558 domain-containing protein [Nocardia sp. NBC_00565]WUC02786.1 DUF3558 domain-containing protein [Nocardia sp. NBC_00565]
MASWSGVVRGVVLGAGVVVLVSACNSGGESKGNTNSASATPTIAADVPAGFDACKDLPQALIQSEKLKNKGADTTDRPGGMKWRGCIWVQSDGYAGTIDTTNITLAMVRANKDFTVDEELTVAGRAALTSHVTGQDPHADCVINVEMTSGSLEISINNPPSAKLTASQHSCEIAKRLAEQIVPAIPATL